MKKMFVIAVLVFSAVFLCGAASAAEQYDSSVYMTISALNGCVGGGLGLSGKYLELEANWDSWSWHDDYDINMGTRYVSGPAKDLGYKRTNPGYGLELHGRYKFNKAFGVYVGPRFRFVEYRHIYEYPGGNTIAVDERKTFSVEAAGGIIVDLDDRLTLRAGIDTSGRAIGGIGVRF